MFALPDRPYRLIGIGGHATSGKDTVAAFLEEDHGFTRTYMSKSLERALLALDPLVPVPNLADIFGGVHEVEHYSELHARVGYDESKKIPEVRRLLQHLGTDVGRNILGSDTWVNATFDQEVIPALERDERVVVTGIRFENELSRLTYLGGVSVWVDRGLPPINAHISDNALDESDFDVTIHNTATLEHLRRATTRILGGPSA